MYIFIGTWDVSNNSQKNIGIISELFIVSGRNWITNLKNFQVLQDRVMDLGSTQIIIPIESG